jgi:hypothetical protein
VFHITRQQLLTGDARLGGPYGDWRDDLHNQGGGAGGGNSHGSFFSPNRTVKFQD